MVRPAAEDFPEPPTLLSRLSELLPTDPDALFDGFEEEPTVEAEVRYDRRDVVDTFPADDDAPVEDDASGDDAPVEDAPADDALVEDDALVTDDAPVDDASEDDDASGDEALVEDDASGDDALVTDDAPVEDAPTDEDADDDLFVDGFDEGEMSDGVADATEVTFDDGEPDVIRDVVEEAMSSETEMTAFLGEMYARVLRLERGVALRDAPYRAVVASDIVALNDPENKGTLGGAGDTTDAFVDNFM